jgi:hypothetical protein
MSTATLQVPDETATADGYVSEDFSAKVRRDTYATAYRLRRQIMPHAFTGLVLAGGLAAHAVAAAGALPAAETSLIVAAASATAGAGLARRVYKRRRRWSRRTVIASAGASLWLAASPFGVGPEQAAALIAFEVVLASRWWQVNRIGYPDADVETPVEPAAEPKWTTREQILLDWRLWVAGQGGPLPGAHLSFLEETPHALVFDLLLHRGKQSITTAISALEKIASGLDLDIDDLVVESHPLVRSLARCRFQVLTDSPIRGDVNFDGPRRRGGFLELGPFADGVGEAVWRLYTDGSMWSGVIIGGTGIGKSRLVENIIISALSGGDTEYWYIDPGRGGSSPALRDHADYFATMDNVDELLDSAMGILDARGEENAVEDWIGFTPSQERPGIIIVIDECHVVLKDRKRAEKVSRIAREGRKFGMCVILIDQDSSVVTFGGLDVLRSSVMEGNAVVLRSTSNSTGQLMPGLLVDPKTLPKIPGYAYVQGSPETGSRTAPFRNRNTAPDPDPDRKVEQVRRWLAQQPRPGLDTLAATATLAAGTFYRDRNAGSDNGRSAAAARIKAMRDGVLPSTFHKRAEEQATAVLGEMGEIIHFPEFSWDYGQEHEHEHAGQEDSALSNSHLAVLAAVAGGAARPREVEEKTGLKHRRVAELLKELVDYDLLRQPSYGRYERAA